MLLSTIISLAVAAQCVTGAGLEDIKHVVLFMQENRAFDHYYGSLKGVRGFKDPNVLVGDNGKPIWYQPTNSSKSEYLLPFYMNEDPEYAESNQCALAGSNSWTANHNAWNDGSVDGWVTNNTAYSWGYYRRDDIPTLYSIIDSWTVADMYAESVISSTCPNRVTWVSGSINAQNTLGSAENIGGPYLDNFRTPGCEEAEDGTEYSCYPLKWKTQPEIFEEQGIDWQVFQDVDNFDDNPLAYFEQYQKAKNGSALQVKGNSFPGLQSFYDRAANGTLPAVSYIVGPMELSEHPPNRPVDGEWLQEKIVSAVINSPKYNETALIISYDETGGFGDHVEPFVAPKGTIGEQVKDFMGNTERNVPLGPGFRVPFYIISPWTRGGRVYTAPSDHTSQIKFLEKWINATFHKDVTIENIGSWRREHMSDLTEFFDFENPDYSVPELVRAPEPKKNGDKWVGPKPCQKKFNKRHAPVPYGRQNETSSLWTEMGYKEVVGALTEGRYVVFSQNGGKCLVVNDGKIERGSCGSGYDNKAARFILHQQGDVFSKKFKVQFAGGGYIKNDAIDEKGGDIFEVSFTQSKGYSLKTGDGKPLAGEQSFFKVFSVT